jgi:hypothetical protein
MLGLMYYSARYCEILAIPLLNINFRTTKNAGQCLQLQLIGATRLLRLIFETPISASNRDTILSTTNHWMYGLVLIALGLGATASG